MRGVAGALAALVFVIGAGVTMLIQRAPSLEVAGALSVAAPGARTSDSLAPWGSVTASAGAASGAGAANKALSAQDEGAPDHVVIVTLPGVVWEFLPEASTPTLHQLAGEGATAGMSVRTAARRTVADRGYLTLGAGNRAFASGTDPQADLAFRRDEVYEGGTAAEALARRTDARRGGEIVHIGWPYLDHLQSSRAYGAEVGALGEALARAGVARSVVSAADLAVEPDEDERRRSAVLALVDRAGRVDHGVLEGLLRRNPTAPFGVSTDVSAFIAATEEALSEARVVLLDPGETLRAEALAGAVPPSQAAIHRRRALERTDAILGGVRDLLGSRDLVLLVSPTGPATQPQEQLTLLAGWGHGVESGWLTSATTRRDGLATLVDVAPTVLEALRIDQPLSMSGTPLRSSPTPRTDRLERLLELNEESRHRERFAPVVAGVFLALMWVVAIGAFIVFLGVPRPRPARWLATAAVLTLAVPVAAVLVRMVGAYRLGDAGAHVLMWGLSGGLAAAAVAMPRRYRTGAGALLAVSAVLAAWDLIVGAPWQLNGAFGYSPIVAGRFYGAGNLGWTILYAATVLGVLGAADLRGRTRARRTFGLLLVALLLLTGLPAFGANGGGMVTVFSAGVITYVLARRLRVRWAWVAAGTVGTMGFAAAVLVSDMLRPPEAQTHLGRLASNVTEGGFPVLWTLVERKIQANLGLLEASEWTFAVPVGVAVLVLMLAKPRGVLRTVVPRHPLLLAGVWGTLAMGVIGFFVNDSGIAIPSMAMSHAVPLLVLLGIETISDPTAEPSTPPGAPVVSDIVRR